MTDQSPVSIMPSAANKQIENTTVSVPERVMFGHDLEWWNEWMLISLAFAALGALAIAFTTTVVAKLQGQTERDAKKALESYKATVSGQVADANRAGVEAGKAAGDAILKAAQADERAAALEVEGAKLKLELARVKTPLLERDITLEQQNELKRELFGKRLQVAIIAPSSEREINKYALKMIATMEFAGVHIGIRYIAGSIENEGINAVPDGLNISGDGPAVSLFRNAFEKAHIPFGTHPLDVNPFKIPGMVFISIGNRLILSK